MVRRLGKFIGLIGGALVALFLLSDIGGQANYKWLFLGLAGLILCFVILRANPSEPSPSSGRFRIIREMKEKNSKKEKK
jgi:uncharacterized membrane protein YccC